MFMIALPGAFVLMVILLYYLIVFYLSRKLFQRWRNNIISTVEFLFLTIAAWVIPLVGPVIAYVVTKYKK